MALAIAACVVAATLTLSGCNSEVEEPNVPADGSSAAVSSSYNYTLTDAEKLKALAIGETAVWRDYEVTVTSVERADGKLTAHVTVRSHTLPQALGADCLLSFGMPPVDSSFEDGIIAVPAGEEASGTLTFDDRYGSERLFWNDGATEGTWDLTLPAVQPDQEGGNEGTQPADTDEPKKQELEAATGASLTVSEYSFNGGIRAVIPGRKILIDNSFQAKLEKARREFTFRFGKEETSCLKQD